MRALLCLALLLAAALVGCGRTPTAPEPCTADRAFKAETVSYAIRDTSGRWINTQKYVSYWCPDR